MDFKSIWFGNDYKQLANRALWPKHYVHVLDKFERDLDRLTAASEAYIRREFRVYVPRFFVLVDGEITLTTPREEDWEKVVIPYLRQLVGL